MTTAEAMRTISPKIGDRFWRGPWVFEVCYVDIDELSGRMIDNKYIHVHMSRFQWEDLCHRQEIKHVDNPPPVQLDEDLFTL